MAIGGHEWLGIWDPSVAYGQRDVVIYKTAAGYYHTYTSKTTHNAGNIPTTSYANWSRLIQEVWSR